MKRIDRLILLDIFGPWLFGVGLFTALIMAATYLGRLAGFIVDGVPGLEVLELTLLYMPQILVKTFSMAVLLAGLLGFGRLSSDSEIVALRAGGASIYRIVAPVAVFSLAISLVTFGFNELVVPAATKASVAITTDAMHRIHPSGEQPFYMPIVTKNKLQAAIIARNINPASQELQGVTVVTYDPQGKVTWFMFADRISSTAGTAALPDENSWQAKGHVRIVPANFGSEMRFDDGVWPPHIPKPVQSFQMAAAEDKESPDSMTMAQLKASIEFHRAQQDKTDREIHDLEFGYWNKIAIPFAAIVFGALGAVLGIRNHRTGTAAGMALAISIIFGYVTLVNFMSIWSLAGLLPPWFASFVPLVIGGVASGVIMWRRNG